jgi:hypothetical protein
LRSDSTFDNRFHYEGDDPFLTLFRRLPRRFLANERLALEIIRQASDPNFSDECIERLLQASILPTVEDRSILAAMLQRTSSAFALVADSLKLEASVLFSGKISAEILKFAKLNGLLVAANKVYKLEAIRRTQRPSRSFLVLPLLGRALNQDRDIVIASIETTYVSRNTSEFEHAPPRIRGDLEVALAAVKNLHGDFSGFIHILECLPQGIAANFDFVSKMLDLQGQTYLDPTYLKHISPALSGYNKITEMFMGQPFRSLSSEQEMKRAVSKYLVRVRDYRRRSKLTLDASLDSASIDEDSEIDEDEIEEDSDDGSGRVHEQEIDQEEDDKFFENHERRKFLN